MLTKSQILHFVILKETIFYGSIYNERERSKYCIDFFVRLM